MMLLAGGGFVSLHSFNRVQSRGSGARTARRCSGSGSGTDGCVGCSGAAADAGAAT